MHTSCNNNRVNYTLSRRLKLLDEVSRLARTLLAASTDASAANENGSTSKVTDTATAAASAEAAGHTCETAAHFQLYHVTARIEVTYSSYILLHMYAPNRLYAPTLLECATLEGCYTGHVSNSVVPSYCISTVWQSNWLLFHWFCYEHTLLALHTAAAVSCLSCTEHTSLYCVYYSL
jgi:hypothetical protein